MTDARARVLVFDSGVGGLSIVRALWQYRAGIEVVYLADNAGFPYGELSERTVNDRCVEVVAQALADYSCELAVIACNTASTIVLPELRALVAVPVVGVVPAIKPAAAVSQNRRIGLLATPATVSRPYIEQLVSVHAPDCSILRVGSSELVMLAENSLQEGAVPSYSVQPILAPFVNAGVDTIILGCTHFPLIRQSLMAAMPEGLHWVDSGEAIARRVDQLLPGSSVKQARGEARMAAFLHSGLEPRGIAAWLHRESVVSGNANPVQIRRVSLNTARNSISGSADW